MRMRGVPEEDVEDREDGNFERGTLKEKNLEEYQFKYAVTIFQGTVYGRVFNNLQCRG
jgi:hypothetical protein